jgi:hypothetical protein
LIQLFVKFWMKQNESVNLIFILIFNFFDSKFVFSQKIRIFCKKYIEILLFFAILFFGKKSIKKIEIIFLVISNCKNSKYSKK